MLVSPNGIPAGNLIVRKQKRTLMSSTEISVMHADGSGVIAITAAYAAYDAQPTWSLDGTWVAFASNKDGDYDLYVVRSDGGHVSTLTRNSAVDSDPSRGR
jgi:Tol biopolymer transport system component